jgi:hypothetical protein
MKYFTVDEFNCQHTGENQMDSEFMEKVDELRDRCGFLLLSLAALDQPSTQ